MSRSGSKLQAESFRLKLKKMCFEGDLEFDGGKHRRHLG